LDLRHGAAWVALPPLFLKVRMRHNGKGVVVNILERVPWLSSGACDIHYSLIAVMYKTILPVLGYVSIWCPAL